MVKFVGVGIALELLLALDLQKFRRASESRAAAIEKPRHHESKLQELPGPTDFLRIFQHQSEGLLLRHRSCTGASWKLHFHV